VIPNREGEKTTLRWCLWQERGCDHREPGQGARPPPTARHTAFRVKRFMGDEAEGSGCGAPTPAWCLSAWGGSQWTPGSGGRQLLSPPEVSAQVLTKLKK